MQTCWTRVLAALGLFSYAVLVITDKIKLRQHDGSAQNQKLRDEIDTVKQLNSAVHARLLSLNGSLLNNCQNDDEPEPPENYEHLRRRIYRNVKNFQNYVNAKFAALNRTIDFPPEAREMIDEQCMVLLRDVSNLTNVDNYSAWRGKESEDLRNLIRDRLGRLQNQPDCKTARKLVCNLNDYCGYICRLHLLTNCFILAYITERTLILNDTAGNWKFTKNGWETLYLPLSDNCNYSSAGITSATAEKWPGRKETRVLSVDIFNFIDPKTNPYLPLEIPEDLAPSLRVLHGDPVFCWIGQFVEYMCRPQPSTREMFQEFAKNVKFQNPIVGVHIRTPVVGTESLLHPVEEYMRHVDDYYRTLELGGDRGTRRIYLASERKGVFAEVKKKYPEYEIIGDGKMAKTPEEQRPDSDQSIRNIVTDVHFLSRCDYVVCAFPSDVCRMVYEMKSAVHPDAWATFRPLDDYTKAIRRVCVAVIPHRRANGTAEIDLETGDPVLLEHNHWNGFSAGLNIRTDRRGLFPTFKVAPKLEFNNFADYPKTIQKQKTNLNK